MDLSHARERPPASTAKEANSDHQSLPPHSQLLSVSPSVCARREECDFHKLSVSHRQFAQRTTRHVNLFESVAAVAVVALE